MRVAHSFPAAAEVAITIEVKEPASKPVDTNPELPPSVHASAPKPTPSTSWSIGRFGNAVAAAWIGATMVTCAVLAPGVETSNLAFGSCQLQTEAVQKAAMAPLGEDAKRLAVEALKYKPDPNHPFLIYKEEVRKRLEKLGLLTTSGDHLHISDVDFEHGGAVLRSALGLNPLATVTATLSVGDVPEEFARQSLRPEQYVRLAPVFMDRMSGPPDPNASEPEMSFEDLIGQALIGFEYDILEKKMRIEMLRMQKKNLPPNARLLVNMSFGTSNDRTAGEIANTMLAAPAGSPLNVLAKRILGAEPLPPPDDGEMGGAQDCGARSRLRPKLPGLMRADEDLPPELVAYIAQVERLKRDLIYPQLKLALKEPEVKSVLAMARADLAKEIALGRKAGVLLFEAAGNEHIAASAAGDAKMSEPTDNDVKGVVLVGAIDMGQPLDPRDDRVAEFSAAGNIAFATPGMNIPNWLERARFFRTKLVEQAGTSFSSPIALEYATAAGAVAPQLSVDKLEALLRDKRVAIAIPNQPRAGAGVLDPFAAVLIAANPKLTRAQIDEAWRALADPKADIFAIRKSLGLKTPEP